MTIYLDPSAMLKRYVDEPDSERFNDILAADPQRPTWRGAAAWMPSTSRRWHGLVPTGSAS